MRRSSSNIRVLRYKVFVKNENRKEIWEYLYDLQYKVRSASNLLYSLYYLRDTQLPTSEVHPATQGYRECRKKFPEIPATTVAPLSNTTFSLYKKERRSIFKGERGVRAYKNGLPIPVHNKQVKFQLDAEGKFEIIWNTVVKGKLKLGVVLGRDRGNYSENLKRIVEGKLKHSDVSFAIIDRDLFILIPVKDEVKTVELDPEVSVGVDLGLAIPAVCAASNSLEHAYIGSREDFLRVRTHLQGVRRRFQRNLRSSKGGHGRQRKLGPLERMEEKEKNFVRQYNHMISHRVVDFALKCRAATIKLEFLEGFSKKDRSSFILRNWSYFQLETQIEYKAKQHGIATVRVDPYHTSQTCSECGNCEEGQREKQAEFKCKKCGVQLNADYNAAKNIALSTKIVTKREQCEYWKREASGQSISRL